MTAAERDEDARRRFVEQMAGVDPARLVFLPAYSPDLNPIEEAFAKLKALLRRAGARTFEALVEAMGRALDEITHRGASGFFRHCGYRVPAQLL